MIPPSVEINTEEVKYETVDEFERIQVETNNNLTRIEMETKERVKIVLDILRQDISELLQFQPDKCYVRQVETYYKQATKNISSAEADGRVELKNILVEGKNQIRKCYDYACEMINKKDRILDKAFSLTKSFMTSNMRCYNRSIKDCCKKAQEEILQICKEAKKNCS